MTFTHTYSANNAGTKAQISPNQAVLGAIQYINLTGAVAYIQLFNTGSSNVTVGTTAPTVSFGIAASASGTIQLGDGWKLGGDGLTVATTTTRANITGASVDLNIAYD